jgi:hypothetical protein
MKNYDKLRLPLGGKASFTVIGWANAPLDQNWAKKAYQHNGLPDQERYALDAHGRMACPPDTYGGWILNGDRITYCTDVDGLAVPNSEPLDAVILNGLFFEPSSVLCHRRISSSNIERTNLEYVPLVLHYDLETKDPTKTRAWLSTQVSYCQNSTKSNNEFAEVAVGEYFDEPTLKKRIARFTKQLKSTFRLQAQGL